MKTFYEAVMEALRGFVEEQCGGKVNAASRALGLKDPSILSQWLTGRRSPSLSAIAPAMDAIGIRISTEDVPPTDYDYVPKVKAIAGCGSSLETSGELEGLYVFRRSFLYREGIHAKKSIMLDVKGESMEPILHQGDTVLVDTSDVDVKDGKIYLVTVGDELMVKRLHKTPRGILLKSENPRYPDITVEGGELSAVIIHGRIRWYGCVCE